MKFMKKQIKEDIKCDLIGGKTFNIERELSSYEVYDGSKKGNVACYNFCIRRVDFFPGFKKKLYYGHIGFLGYVICEDELEREID